MVLHVNTGGGDERIGSSRFNQVSIYCLQNTPWGFPFDHVVIHAHPLPRSLPEVSHYIKAQLILHLLQEAFPN